jgi:hypothetical protein
MRGLAAAACATLLLASIAAPAAAFVVEVTTSVSVEDAEDNGQIRTALQAAVENVLHEAIAFRPTLIVLTHAMVMGHRLYVRMLLADADGEQTFHDLGPDGQAPDGQAPDGDDAPAAAVGEDIQI